MPGESHGQRRLEDQGVTELDMTEQLDDDLSIFLQEAFPQRTLIEHYAKEFMSLGQALGLPFTGLMTQNKLLHLPGQGHWIQLTSVKGIFVETEVCGTHSEVH